MCGSMTRSMKKTTIREITGSLGRFVAIAAIIALGVGFFAGLRTTTEDMIAETNLYLKELKFFDFRLVSTLGFTDAELTKVQSEAGVKAAAGEYQKDVIYEPFSEDGVPAVMSVHSLTEGVNEIKLVAGRLPEREDEILLEARSFSEKIIGKKVIFSESNPEETLSAFGAKEYTVVGIGHSPLYMNYERGTSTLLDGTVSVYAYIIPEAFRSPAYSSLYVRTNNGEKIYSDAYKAHVDKMTEPMQRVLDELADSRVSELREAALPEVKRQVAEKYAELGMQVPEDFDYESYIPEFEADTYLLGRDTNIGYVCFENDANIVAGIARVFPVFFILVAVLVVMTTMNRMMEEQRTQMGILKALGYSATQISVKYIIYSGTAAVSGCLIGFFSGNYIFPTVIWRVYGIMYGFTTDLVYVMNPVLFAICFTVSVLCSVGVTLVSINRELRSVPAELIRPRAPKSGKRILLERVGFFWKRLPFLHKVSLRNVVRYRKRFFMMVLGIAGCTALLITGHGIRDSITSTAPTQYDEIEVYDYLIRLTDGKSRVGFLHEAEGLLSSEAFIDYGTMSVTGKDGTKTPNYFVPMKAEEYLRYVNLTDEDGEAIAFPAEGECLLSRKMAEQIGAETGDTVTCRKEGGRSFPVKVSGVFRNYVGNTVIFSRETYEAGTGEASEFRYLMAKAEDRDQVFETGAKLMALDSVMSVSINREFRDRIEAMLVSLDDIVVLVIFCAALLAFIVLYNLTNINITERIREIATIKVLGFYSAETALYVFRENMILTAFGALLGIPGGILLNRFVMSQIQVDLVSFPLRITAKSFLISIAFTFAFAVLTDLVMLRKLSRINMAESMKSIE